MTPLILWLLFLVLSVTWGALGWRASRRWEALYDRSVITRRDEQREHWRALGATYGTVQAAKDELAEANERLIELEVANRLLLRYHEALEVYAGDADAAYDAEDYESGPEVVKREQERLKMQREKYQRALEGRW